MKNFTPYFWNHEYRHELRSASIIEQNKVLRLFVNNNLEPAGKSNKHLSIIESIIN